MHMIEEKFAETCFCVIGSRGGEPIKMMHVLMRARRAPLLVRALSSEVRHRPPRAS